MNQAQTKPQTKPQSYALLKSVLYISAEMDKDETVVVCMYRWVDTHIHAWIGVCVYTHAHTVGEPVLY